MQDESSHHLQRLGSAVCIIELDVEGIVGTGFLGVFPERFPGLLFLITCRHVLPDEAACCNAICTFEAAGQPGHSLTPSPALGFAALASADVTIARISSEVAAGLPRNQEPQEVETVQEPQPGEDLVLHGYCRGSLFRNFQCRVLAVNEQILRYAVLCSDLPEMGVSGSPLTNRRGQAVAVHMGLSREGSGVEGRATLLQAAGLPSSLQRPAPLPRRVCVAGRRGTNDILNGIYEVTYVLADHPVWVSTATSSEKTHEARRLFLYKGTKSRAWTVGTRLGDGLLRSEGGMGGVVARRVVVGDGDDPSEVCVLPALRGWEVATGMAGVLRPDGEVVLSPMSEATFAQARLHFSA
ncbi:RMD1 [Symbiodinium natans]|uniref:RMD1 protein n=1 Tax=Symbiodinium natans TaxID=878477 RepID=A0A812MT21_9DINO|nr:RMD1 [Symbiodinium natans]